MSAIHSILCISIRPRTLTWKSISPVKSRWEKIHLSEVKNDGRKSSGPQKRPQTTGKLA